MKCSIKYLEIQQLIIRKAAINNWASKNKYSGIEQLLIGNAAIKYR